MKKGQSIAEYTILIGIVSFALAGMYTYAKRGIQVVTKVSADKLAEDFGGQQTSIGMSNPDWMDIWQPPETLSRVDNSIESASAQIVDSKTGKSKMIKGSFSQTNIKNFSLSGRRLDKEQK